MSAPVQGGLTDDDIYAIADEFRSTYKHGGRTFDSFDALGFGKAIEQHVIASQSAAPVAASDAVHFVKSLIHPNGWHECTADDLEGHVRAGFVTRTLFATQAASGSAQPADSYDAAAMDRQYLAGYDAGFMAGEAGDGAKRAAVQASRSRSIREARAPQAATVTGAQAGAGRPQVVMLAGDTLELCVIDKDGLLKAIPGSHSIGMPWQWIAALHGYSAIKAMAPVGEKP